MYDSQPEPQPEPEPELEIAQPLNIPPNYLTSDAERVFDMTQMSVGGGSALELVPDAIGPDGNTGSVWRMQHFISGGSYMGFGGHIYQDLVLKMYLLVFITLVYLQKQILVRM